MLEKKIEELTKAVRDLTAAIQQQSPTEKSTPDPTEKPTTAPTSQKENSREDLNQELQAKSLQMIRDGKTTKPDIKKLIADHGGILIKDIPDEEIDNFKVALEELANG